MDVPSTAKSLCVWRFCARVVVAFCLLAFGLGDAVERGFSGHVGLDGALAHAVSTEQAANVSADHSGVHVDDRSGAADQSGDVVGHGCHGCSALPEPMRQIAATPLTLGLSLAWASVPSAAGREPLIDLPPPRA